MTELTLHFEDYDQTGYLIRFGHKEHLEQILNGKIRFTNLKKYQRDENKNIGDVNEGVRTFLHQNGELKITFSHPLLEHGKEIDITKDDYMGIVDKNIICCNPDKVESAFQAVKAMVDDFSSIITIIVGADATEEEKNKLLDRINKELPVEDIEIECHQGNQPVYDFIIGVE